MINHETGFFPSVIITSGLFDNCWDINKGFSSSKNKIASSLASFKTFAWFINGLQGITETPTSQKIVDTTGAGDAFLAGLISKLISSGYPSNKLEIEDCVKFAGVCGLLTCLGEGAIEQQPYYEKVNEFLGSLIS